MTDTPRQVAMWAVGIAALGWVLAIIGWLAADYYHTAHDVAQASQLKTAAQLAAFYAVDESGGKTPADIIEHLTAELQGKDRALDSFSADVTALTWLVRECKFDGPDPAREPRTNSGEVVETEATGSGPTRLESE